MCSVILSTNTVQGFEDYVSLDGHLGAATVWPESLQRDELTRKQSLYIRAVQLRWVRTTIYQYQSGKLMMTQHSRLPSYRFNSATGLHYRPRWLTWLAQCGHLLGHKVWLANACLSSRSERTC